MPSVYTIGVYSGRLLLVYVFGVCPWWLFMLSVILSVLGISIRRLFLMFVIDEFCLCMLLTSALDVCTWWLVLVSVILACS